jgi:gamma-glutamyl:cysteine ligase YbdK (ATP-grasp superfamily)
LPRNSRLHLFEGYGVELEYAIVGADTLDVVPLADDLIKAERGRYATDAEVGAMGWSNEFARHVIEVRNLRPVPDLAALAPLFRESVGRMNAHLAPMGARLMPGSMHPWMDPARETRLWERRNRRIYAAYDRIFGCRSHGWANIQSMQLNLPFADDGEFARLHAALRLVLPLLPALTASSPLREGRLTGLMDTRIAEYRRNQECVPSVAGDLVPETARGRAEYERTVLAPMYRAIAPLDPGGLLRHEWLNSRGAIARFDRSAIEVRLADIQECPRADVAVAMFVARIAQLLVEERWTGLPAQEAWDAKRLLSILLGTARDAEEAVIGDADYLRAFGYPRARARAGDLLVHLAAFLVEETPGSLDPLRAIFRRGTLARRIARALGPEAGRGRMREVYEELCECLARGTLFRAI